MCSMTCSDSLSGKECGQYIETSQCDKLNTYLIHLVAGFAFFFRVAEITVADFRDYMRALQTKQICRIVVKIVQSGSKKAQFLVILQKKTFYLRNQYSHKSLNINRHMQRLNNINLDRLRTLTIECLKEDTHCSFTDVISKMSPIFTDLRKWLFWRQIRLLARFYGKALSQIQRNRNIYCLISEYRSNAAHTGVNSRKMAILH